MNKPAKIEALKGLANTLHYVSDFDVMMETILSEARRFAGAEAGSIYIRNDDKLIFSYSQNDHFKKINNQAPPFLYKDLELSIHDNSLAGYVAREGQALNIADAYAIKADSSYAFEPEFDNKSGYLTRSILTLPLKDAKGNCIGVLQLINHLNNEGNIGSFAQDDVDMMMIFSSTAAMALERASLTRQMVLRIIKMAELRDPIETSCHAQRVGGIAVMLYEKWAERRDIATDLIKSNVDRLRMAAMLHDVGKVGISDHVLNKPGRLSREERMEMEKHVLIGMKLFEPVSSDLDEMIREVILHHHERWDGLGYPGWIDPYTGEVVPGHANEHGLPQGRKGEEISIFGRVTAVADVFDALCSRRVYKEPFDDDLVSQIMRQESGRHFDPELVEILLDNLSYSHIIRDRYSD